MVLCGATRGSGAGPTSKQRLEGPGDPLELLEGIKAHILMVSVTTDTVVHYRAKHVLCGAKHVLCGAKLVLVRSQTGSDAETPSSRG